MRTTTSRLLALMTVFACNPDKGESDTTDLCDSYADRLIECGLAEAEWKVDRAFECTMAMAEARFEFSEACGDASEASLTCVIASTCEQIDHATSCEAEAAAADMICE